MASGCAAALVELAGRSCGAAWTISFEVEGEEISRSKVTLVPPKPCWLRGALTGLPAVELRARSGTTACGLVTGRRQLTGSLRSLPAPSLAVWANPRRGADANQPCLLSDVIRRTVLRWWSRQLL
jgi:hypothetical protein